MRQEMENRAIHVDWEKHEIELPVGGRFVFYLGGPDYG